MGTDISMYAEVFDGERWRPAEPFVEDEFYDPEDVPPNPKFWPQSVYSSRNRALFAILTENIARPRGLPEDVSPEIAAFGSHSYSECLFNHSCLTLEELLAFDWKGTIVQMSGVVEQDVASLFEGNPLGFPYERWPEGKPIAYAMLMRGGVCVRWRETAEQLAGPDFMEGALAKLKSYGPTKSVRVVFWFDH
jgi:hypothetical protein